MDKTNSEWWEDILDIPGIKQFCRIVCHIYGWLMTPQVIFGSPIQRFLTGNEKKPTFYIPITIKPRVLSKKLEDCKIILQLLDEKELNCSMCWYSDITEQEKPIVTLKPNTFFLVSVVTRTEGNVYITDRFYNDSKDYKLEPRRDKYVFRLKVLSGKKKEQISGYYAIRNSSLNEGTVFTVEMIYEGLGTELKYVQG